MTQAHGVARDQLRSLIERIERVEEEIKTLNDDKSDIYKEARSVGFDVKVLRKVVAKRKLDTHVRDEQDAIFDMYWHALYGAPVHVHTHARENIEKFDPETATEAPKQVYGDSVDRATARPSEPVDIPAGGAEDHKIDGSDDRGPAEPIHAGSSSGKTPDFGSGNASSIPALAYNPLRPHCQHPGDTCGGYGRKHCHSCERAPAEMAGAA